MRIVSLLPSATEILFTVGAGDDVVGVTFECDWPAEARTRRVVSNTALPHGLTPAEIDAAVAEKLAAGEDIYRLDEGALRDIDPELVVTQDLCAVCAVDVANVDDALTHLGCRAQVLTVDPQTLDAVIESVVTIGDVVGRGDEAREIAASLRARLDAVHATVEVLDRPRVVVVEWTDPPFDAGHWVPDMVEAAGGTAVLGHPGHDSQRMGWGDVAAAQPDVIVVSPCGYRLDGAADLAAQVVDAGVLPEGVPVWAVDADAAYVRPGPRLVDGVEALAAILHPEAGPVPEDLARRVR